MNLSKIVKIFAVLGILFSGYVSYALLEMNDHALPWWNFSYGVLFCVCMACGWGLWNQKKWAYRLSLILAVAGLGLGLYFAHFGWTFWIFKRPSFFERVLAVLNPRIFIFTVFPVVWLAYFARTSVRACFQS